MDRIEYLSKVSVFTEKPIKHLFKKEIQGWVESTFADLRISMNNNHIAFRKDGLNYFIYEQKYCHFYFVELPDPSLDIWHVLKKIFKYSNNEFDGLMRFHVKNFIKKHNLIHERKIKFFRQRL